MDVKDYSQQVDQARDKYRQAQEDLRTSYDKNTENIKSTADNKVSKLSKSYDNQKSKLEEQNLISNKMYSDKTKEVIADRAERFRNDIKKNTEKFDTDRNGMKSEFSDKLSNLSDSYKKSTDENNRFHDQAVKSMSDRFTKSTKNSTGAFEKQLEHLGNSTREELANEKEDAHKFQLDTDRANQENLESLRSNSQEQKFKEVSRLRNDNENLRTNFEQERGSLHEQQEARINDIMRVKKEESEDGQRNFTNLQQGIREKNLAAEEKVKQDHLAESKELKKSFNEDLRNMQHMTNQKIKGGNEVSTLKDENKNLITSYENRLQAARNDAKKDMNNSTEKEDKVDEVYREELKNLKATVSEENDHKDSVVTAQTNKTLQEIKDKNNSVIDRYKSEAMRTQSDGDEKLAKADTKSKGQLKDQRVEFGKFINNVNDKKLEEISSIKNEYSKDKTNFMEKTKKDISLEKNQLKDGFNHQLSVKEDLYERKLAEMEKQTNKIIDNYESRMNQLARKSEKEVEVMKNTEDARKMKEDQAVRAAFENSEREHQIEIGGVRSKYENMINKDRTVAEQQTNHIVQKYEDQLERERSDHQKELSMKLGESQAQFERLFKASQLEKETLRNQFEQRIENMKNSNPVQGNSKKA
jgi:hypothetical protein